MINRTFAFRFILLASLTLLSVANATAQEPAMDPQLPGNPLTRMMSGMNPANWTMPKLKMPSMSRFLPTKQEQDRVITKKDSLVTEVSNTAKKSWQRTKDTLNPMRLIPAGFKQGAETTPAPPAKQEPGFFSRLFSPFPEPAEQSASSTVTDFLKQDAIR